MSPSSVQAYTNAGFQEAETYEMRGTLAVRQPEVVRSSVVPFGEWQHTDMKKMLLTSRNFHFAVRIECASSKLKKKLKINQS